VGLLGQGFMHAIREMKIGIGDLANAGGVTCRHTVNRARAHESKTHQSHQSHQSQRFAISLSFSSNYMNKPNYIYLTDAAFGCIAGPALGLVGLVGRSR